MKSMLIERRAFLSGCLASVAPGRLPGRSVGRKEARLVVGLLADIHLKDKSEYPGGGSADKLERAFRCFDAHRADAVLISGDLADNGIVPQLEQLAAIWNRCFPGNRRSDGAPIERLFHFGDHDTGGYAHKASFFKSNERLKSSYCVDDSTLEAWAMRRDPAAVWHRVFGEDYAPIQHKRIKGYDFILAHWSRDLPGCNDGNATPGLAAVLDNLKPDPTKPFFFSQHRVYRGTVGGLFAWGQDDGSTARILSAYPNAVAFCGHGHLTATDESVIWQGAFTAIEIPSLRYVSLEPGHANKVDVSVAEQGLLMSVFDHEIVIERFDVGAGEKLGPDWRFPVGAAARPYAPAERLKTEVAPEFSTADKVDVREVERTEEEGRRFEIVFPPARKGNDTPRAYDYEISVACVETGGRVVRADRRVFSASCVRAESLDRQSLRCLIGEKDLAVVAHGELVVRVTPCGRFGRRGFPLVGRLKIG